MLKVQYASDLHIDGFPKGTPFESFLTPLSPILILAGDICSAWNPMYEHFLLWCSRHWHTVILITGNHEYHVESHEIHTIEQTDARIRELTRRMRNVAFLQSAQSYTIPGTRLRFVGATLWSAVDPALWDEAAAKKGDYKETYVQVSGTLRKTHPSDTTALHALHKALLTSAIAPHHPRETLIVVTHHMPTMNLLEPRFRGERWHSCYVSNDDDLLQPGIAVWVCGHTHRATRWQAPRGGPLCVMNARGYNQDRELNRATDVYSPTATIELRI